MPFLLCSIDGTFPTGKSLKALCFSLGGCTVHCLGKWWLRLRQRETLFGDSCYSIKSWIKL
jgi:hypothetical protein